MRKRMIVALALGLALTLTGCSGNAPDAGTGDAAGSNASKESVNATDGSEPDGMASADGGENAVILEPWKATYAEFLEKEIVPWLDRQEPEWRRDGWTFGFIYVNDDPSPELVISSGYEAAGNIICTIIDGKVEQLQTSRLSFYYEEFGNKLNNAEGHMGCYYDDIFTITDKGFELVHEGVYNELYDENGPTGEMEYAMDGKAVTKEEYFETVDATFVPEERIFWEKGSGYDEVIAYLKGNGPKNYQEAYSELIRNGMVNFNDEMKGFALIERDDHDPLLLCVGDKSFCFCAYEDGLVQIGPYWYFSEAETVLVYPNVGLIENLHYGDNEPVCIGGYWMQKGSLCNVYVWSEYVLDENMNLILDQSDLPVTRFVLNGAEVSKQDFYVFTDRNDESYFLHVVGCGEEYTFIDYLDGDQMLRDLAK